HTTKIGTPAAAAHVNSNDRRANDTVNTNAPTIATTSATTNNRLNNASRRKHAAGPRTSAIPPTTTRRRTPNPKNPRDTPPTARLGGVAASSLGSTSALIASTASLVPAMGPHPPPVALVRCRDPVTDGHLTSENEPGRSHGAARSLETP